METQAELLALMTKERATKRASAMTEADFQSLRVLRFTLNDAFWLKVKIGVSKELFKHSKPVVESFTAQALDLLRLATTAEDGHVQPLVRKMIKKLMDFVNGHFGFTFSMDCEQTFTTGLPTDEQPVKVMGKYDAAILDDTGVQCHGSSRI